MSKTRVLLVALAVSLVVSMACDSDAATEVRRPVVVTPRLGTPLALAGGRFSALPGARAYWGEANGGMFRAEIPDNWNGDLVVFMHGSHTGPPPFIGTVDFPSFRAHLVEGGYAWIASSYDRNQLISGIAADQSAWLWDYFAARFGTPRRSYANGSSMGGAAALISAERYADRYDGALIECAIAGFPSDYDVVSDLVVAGAFVAEVTQDEFDSIPSFRIVARIESMLEDPDRRTLFEELYFGLSGGRRAYDAEGFRRVESDAWRSAVGLVKDGRADNRAKRYELPASAGVGEEEFNSRALRFAPGESRVLFEPDGEPSGRIAIPVLALHTTGDPWIPLSEFNLIRDRIDSAGRSDDFRSWMFEAPGHCEWTAEEADAAFDALVAWVEEGEAPDDRYVPAGE